MTDLPKDINLLQEFMRLPIELDGILYESNDFNYDEIFFQMKNVT